MSEVDECLFLTHEIKSHCYIFFFVWTKVLTDETMYMYTEGGAVVAQLCLSRNCRGWTCGPTEDSVLLGIVSGWNCGPTQDTILLGMVGGWNCGPTQGTILLGIV